MTKGSLPRRRLGRTGFEVTQIGLGGVWLGRGGNDPDERLAVATVTRALELGINLIDTSGLYMKGRSEVFIGTALQEWFRGAGKRQDVIISTKTGTRTRQRDYSAKGTRNSIEQSLRALQLEYIDLALVHDPEHLRPVLSKGGAWEELIRLKEEGLVRAIGIGVRNHSMLQRMINADECDVILTYRDYNLLSQGIVGDVLPCASWRNVGVINGMAIMKGLLGGGDPQQVAADLDKLPELSRVYRPSPKDVAHAKDMWDWAQQRGISLLALNLQYCMREERIASTVLGAAAPDEIESDVTAACTPIDEQTRAEFKKQFSLR